MFGGGHTVGIWSVHNGDSGPMGSFEVDVVESHAGSPDHCQTTGCRDQPVIDPGGGADDERVGFGTTPIEAFPGLTDARIDVKYLCQAGKP
jgi:hypothetical protein